MLRVLTAWYERPPGEFTVDWEWGELIDNAAAEALRNNTSRRYNAMKAESAADRIYNEFRSLRIAARRNCGKDELNADPILLRTNNSEISKRRGQVTLNAALLASGADVAEGTGRPCRKEAFRRAQERLADVGISRADTRAHQYPHELSGGMQQRAMIAMGLMGTPRLIIADEPTSAFDVMTQSRVLSLLDQACARDNAALLLISHDITVIRRGCDRVLVMYAGRVVEDLPSADLAATARHPYTTALLSSVPDLDTDRTKPLTVIPGRAPEPGEITRGCPFAPRCLRADDQCLRQEPDLVRAGPEHRVACWHPAPPGTPHLMTTDEPLETDHA